MSLGLDDESFAYSVTRHQGRVFYGPLREEINEPDAFRAWLSREVERLRKLAVI